MDCVFHEATCLPSTSTIVLRGPHREYQLPRAALILDGPYLLVRDRGRLAEVDDELRGRLIDLGVEEAPPPPPRVVPRPVAKWTPRSRFLLHRNDGEPRLVYGDTLDGVYGVPKLWAEDYGCASMSLPAADRNLTHLGTGLAVTKQLVRISDIKCLGEALLEQVPEVTPAGTPSAELLGRMRAVVAAYLETVDPSRDTALRAFALPPRRHLRLSPHRGPLVVEAEAQKRGRNFVQTLDILARVRYTELVSRETRTTQEPRP